MCKLWCDHYDKVKKTFVSKKILFWRQSKGRSGRDWVVGEHQDTPVDSLESIVCSTGRFTSSFYPLKDKKISVVVQETNWVEIIIITTIFLDGDEGCLFFFKIPKGPTTSPRTVLGHPPFFYVRGGTSRSHYLRCLQVFTEACVVDGRRLETFGRRIVPRPTSTRGSVFDRHRRFTEEVLDGNPFFPYRRGCTPKRNT